HRDCWFLWDGKPLLLAPPSSVPEEAREFFTVRESWAWSRIGAWFGDGHEKWPWVDHTPQAYGWDTDPNSPTAMPVAVAQHPVNNIGRSHHGDVQPTGGDLRTGDGVYFQEQWERALDVDPELIFVTGWNEWVAMRFLNEGNVSMLGKPPQKGETFFVDQ